MLSYCWHLWSTLEQSGTPSLGSLESSWAECGSASYVYAGLESVIYSDVLWIHLSLNLSWPLRNIKEHSHVPLFFLFPHCLVLTNCRDEDFASISQFPNLFGYFPDVPVKLLQLFSTFSLGTSDRAQASTLVGTTAKSKVPQGTYSSWDCHGIPLLMHSRWSFCCSLVD